MDKNIAIGEYIHLIMWKDRKPYCGSVRVTKVSDGTVTYAIGTLEETLYVVEVDVGIIFDRDLLVRKFKHLKSELLDIREVFRDYVPKTAELRVVQLGENHRCNVSGEWNMLMSIYEIHASPELKIV